uniref:HNH endonuclease n=1 Tax=Anaerolinea thermolimosa TaxID=229919 RepID=A0A7C4KHU6_9CHLR
MRKVSRENRGSAEYAKSAFEGWYASRSILTACARLLADCINAAHQISASCWTVTLFQEGVRLNVGPLEVLVLQQDSVYLIISDSDDGRFNNSKFHDSITPSGVYYPSVPIYQRRCNVSPAEIKEFYPLVAENHQDLIQRAARRRKETSWKSNFSPGVILYLNNLLEVPVPWPAYAERPNILQEIEQFKDGYEALEETTRESVIQSRIGQGQFRTFLINYWKGCSVTGCRKIEVLRASHIKPWRDSSNDERLDVYNGLLLLPNLDACFDSGLITFDDEGKIIISKELNETTLTQLGISSDMKLSRVDEKHKAFLRFHREHIFRR